MLKREGASIRSGNHKVKKRKGVKIRSTIIPDSDEENPPLNANTEYARLVRTRVTASGKVGSITTSSLPIVEAAGNIPNPPPEVDVGHTIDTVAEDTTVSVFPIAQKRKKPRRKRGNDSVSPPEELPSSS